ncbi:hypothetical protein GcM1_c11470o2 [Golovinomyces cichoracearum]|uniref:Uncharacterized protein n=1 Tax=Golovinomyces cichoracearum TaxID=62708 RepID=A0A420J0F8_9PEZI|nr:hypothetical protein GcM1_c11470o2 [Golovinomyces cichoracearum]
MMKLFQRSLTALIFFSFIFTLFEDAYGRKSYFICKKNKCIDIKPKTSSRVARSLKPIKKCGRCEKIPRDPKTNAPNRVDIAADEVDCVGTRNFLTRNVSCVL